MIAVVNRDPGTALKRALRREVNFGCPVRYGDGGGCGCPILTYHHFDPPWEPSHVHNPEGLIALCRFHADQADGGVWTKQQLREMKRNPYVDDAIRVRWPWRTESMVARIGPMLVIGEGSTIALNGNPVLSFTQERLDDLGCDAISFAARVLEKSGLEWIRIEGGWLEVFLGGTENLEFSPQTRTFRASNRDHSRVGLQLKLVPLRHFPAWFRPYVVPRKSSDPEELVELALAHVQKYGAVDGDNRVPVVELRASLRTPEVDLFLGKKRLRTAMSLPNHTEPVFNWPTTLLKEGVKLHLKVKGQDDFLTIG